MAINQILSFGTVPGANVLTPADYQALAARLAGFSSGTAKSKELNTVWRQASFVTAMIAQYIADKAGQDVLDNGDSAVLQANFVAALAASPAFTGSPTAPTPSAADNSTKVATTAFVRGILVSPSFTGIPTAPTAAVGTNTTQLATTAFVAGAVSVAVPAGCVMSFAMAAAPAGWLKANGAAVSRSTYSALFAAIGTTFGAGDGSTTFNLPDLRGEFVRYWDDGKGTDPSRAFGSGQTDQLQNHNHAHGIIAASGVTSGNQQYVVSSSGNAQNTQGISGSGANPANFGAETRPRNVALLACIKY